MGFYAPEDKVFVSTKVFNALVKEVLSYRIDGVLNGSFTRGSATTLICGGQSGSSIPAHPYQGYDASDGDTPRVKIQKGTHSGFVPTVGGTPMAVDIEENILTLSSSAQIVYAQLNLEETDGEIEITSVEINSSNDAEAPENTETEAYQILFFVSVTIDDDIASIEVAPNVLGSQDVVFCGGLPAFNLV